MSALVLGQAADVTDSLSRGGLFAIGAGAVLAMGRLGWIRFPPSPEQTKDKDRLERLTDDLIARHSTALMDAILATREVTTSVGGLAAAVARLDAAQVVTAAELARLSAAATGIATGLAGRRDSS
jgi:hypothetical protein